MMDLFNNHTRIRHNPAEFTERCSQLHAEGSYDEFLRCALTGEYQNAGGNTFQVHIDLDAHYLPDEEDITVVRDIDSAIGISDNILVSGPLSVWAAPHSGHELKTSIHLVHSGLSDGNGVPYHRIPNFELGTFGNRHAVNIFFPKLWNTERARPFLTTEREREFWYQHGFRKAIQSLGTDHIASEFPATVQSERERAKKKSGQISWGTKMLDELFVPFLADEIRTQLHSNQELPPNDVEWARDFFFVHMIRGVKQAYIHDLDFDDSEFYLDRFFANSQLAPNASEHGSWWIDIGIEISSSENVCLQWNTGWHRELVRMALGVSGQTACNMTRISYSRYERDPSGHLPDVSGFRLAPGRTCAGDFNAAYVQAYTTDKSVTYNVEGTHHAKFLTATEVLGSKQPCPTVDAIYTLYENAREHNPSKARLEVRVPYRFATEVLVNVDEDILRKSLFSFTGPEWWNLRLIRLTACSQVFSLQAVGMSHHRFMPESLLLTAACIWLVNSLHSRPEDGLAARELMRAVLPLTEADDDIEDAAYNPHRRAEWIYGPTGEERPRFSDGEARDEEAVIDALIPLIPCHPDNYYFLRRIVLGENGVPRMRAGGNGLSPSAFKFWFDQLTLDGVTNKFQRSGIVSQEVIAQTRSTLVKRHTTLEYIRIPGEDEAPVLFNLGARGFTLAPMADDDGSDLDDRDSPTLPNDDIDTVLSDLWRQMVMDIKSKSPNQGNATAPSYLLINNLKRKSPDEAIFRHLNFPQLFDSVWYKNGSKEQWKTSFDCLLPKPGVKKSAKIQNYLQCRYYKQWLRILDANKNNPTLIKAIRDAFWHRIREWSWFPNAQSDKMWTTSVKKPNNRSFIRWPVDLHMKAAPHIYLHSGGTPIFELPPITDHESDPVERVEIDDDELDMDYDQYSKAAEGHDGDVDMDDDF